MSVAKVSSSSETEISSRMLTCRVTCVALLSESKSQIPTTATHRYNRTTKNVPNEIQTHQNNRKRKLKAIFISLSLPSIIPQSRLINSWLKFSPVLVTLVIQFFVIGDQFSSALGYRYCVCVFPLVTVYVIPILIYPRFFLKFLSPFVD